MYSIINVNIGIIYVEEGSPPDREEKQILFII